MSVFFLSHSMCSISPCQYWNTFNNSTEDRQSGCFQLFPILHSLFLFFSMCLHTYTCAIPSRSFVGGVHLKTDSYMFRIISRMFSLLYLRKSIYYFTLKRGLEIGLEFKISLFQASTLLTLVVADLPHLQVWYSNVTPSR